MPCHLKTSSINLSRSARSFKASCAEFCEIKISAFKSARRRSHSSCSLLHSVNCSKYISSLLEACRSKVSATSIFATKSSWRRSHSSRSLANQPPNHHCSRNHGGLCTHRCHPTKFCVVWISTGHPNQAMVKRYSSELGEWQSWMSSTARIA